MAKATNKRISASRIAGKGPSSRTIKPSVISRSAQNLKVATLGDSVNRLVGADIVYTSSDDKNLLHIIDVVRSGISPSAFDELTTVFPFTLAEWATYLQLSERTIQRNQKEKKVFQPIQSEKIVELAMLYKYGVDVFGDKDNFDIWLDFKNIALGGRKPKELLDTNFGINMVKDELARIEHGVLA